VHQRGAFHFKQLVTELPMPIASRDKQSTAAMKQRRAQEATQAMKDYEAEKLTIRAKTERLRAERLAREVSQPTTKPTKKKR
jgi:hypothetical protein